MSGVGTELGKLLPKWALKKNRSCRCSETANELDENGIKWCEDNFDQIVLHLTHQSEHLILAFRLVPASGRRAIAEQLVKQAIKNAQLHQT